MEGCSMEPKMEPLPVPNVCERMLHWGGKTYDRGLSDELGVAEDECEAVVVNVEEGEVVALQHQQHGIEQLPDLEEIVDVVKSF